MDQILTYMTWQIAFQSSGGELWVVGTVDNRENMHIGMMAGTSPSIAIWTDRRMGRWQAAFQSSGGELWVVGTGDSPGNMHLGMMAGTNPSSSLNYRNVEEFGNTAPNIGNMGLDPTT
jgi:hypothetical protein